MYISIVYNLVPLNIASIILHRLVVRKNLYDQHFGYFGTRNLKTSPEKSCTAEMYTFFQDVLFLQAFVFADSSVFRLFMHGCACLARLCMTWGMNEEVSCAAFCSHWLCRGEEKCLQECWKAVFIPKWRCETGAIFRETC